MGPTASGKTRLALELTQQLPCDIVSVDSAMVYRGMDIGTAKPTPAERALAPHRLIDIVDPTVAYSAGQFCQDALQAIHEIHAVGRIPLLVGGTFLYFRALQQGLSPLPCANTEVRERLSQEAAVLGWSALHDRLRHVDPDSAQRISPTDGQRIQRALEIYELTGLPRSDWFTRSVPYSPQYRYISVGLAPSSRADLLPQIESRWHSMLRSGLLEEVQTLKQRGDLSLELPALRAVGYRQVWQYLEGSIDYQQMQTLALTATAQLAKRQMTWLRSWHSLQPFDCFDPQLSSKVTRFLKKL